MFVVDTNFLIHAAHQESDQHKKALAILKQWQRQEPSWHSTWSIFYEFLRATTHRAVFRKPLKAKQAQSFLQSLLDSPGFSLLLPTEKHSFYWQSFLEKQDGLSGNLWHDAHIAI